MKQMTEEERSISNPFRVGSVELQRQRAAIGRNKLMLETLSGVFSVCKVEDYSQVDFEIPFVFTGRTDSEKSLVCPSGAVPRNVLAREDGWKGFRISGMLDFALVGILADISGILAEKKIPIFAVSTYDTDHVFIKETFWRNAVEALKNEGYLFAENKKEIVSADI